MWRRRERRGKGEREGEKEGEKEERQRGRKRKGGSRNDTRYFSSLYEISAPRRFCFLGQNEAQMMSVVLWMWPPLWDLRGGGSHHKAPPRVSLHEEDRIAELTEQQDEGVQLFISGIASLYDIKSRLI